jgi:hypothetical protein
MGILKRRKIMPQIDYSKIPYKEKRSTGEHVKSNAFYMPKVPEPDSYEGYEAIDFFGLEFVHYEFDKDGKVVREDNGR